MALVAATVAYVGGGDDRETGGSSPVLDGRDEPTAPDDPPPATTPDAPALSDEEFLALVETLQADVVEARGLDFLREVDVELADVEEFEARLLEDFEESIDDIAETEIFYRALGLLRGDRTLYEELEAIYSAGVLGFYDPETDELVVRGTSPTPFVQQTIVHELVHALDDQHFELHRPRYEDRDDEIAVGFSAVVEGNARRIEQEWLGSQPREFREQARAEEAAFASQIDVDAFPPILLFQIGAPYQLGEVFVRQLLAQRGERGVDAALTEPPDTSEQFLFPDRYLDRDPRLEVPPPPADAEIVDEGVIGALFLFGLFTTGDSTVNEVDAVRAVQGWGGDWAVTWREGEAACLRADFVGDTEEDTDELGLALDAWADGRGVGTVTTTDDGRVRLESCTASGAVAPQA